jgi:hypothetical protein
MEMEIPVSRQTLVSAGTASLVKRKSLVAVMREEDLAKEAAAKILHHLHQPLLARYP